MKIYHIIFFIACMLISIFFSCDSIDLGLGQGTHYPEKPYRLYPYNGSINQSRTPVFSWLCEEDDPDFESTLTYEVRFQKSDDTGSLHYYETDDKSLPCPITLDSETEYLFWVKAVTEDNITKTSEKDTFTTGTGFNNPPHPPILSVPVYRMPPTTYPIDLIFMWTCHDPDGDNLIYDVLLAVDPQTLDPDYEVLSEGQTETTYQPTSLEYDTRYYLLIIAYDAESETRGAQTYFRTDEEDVSHGIYAELMIHRSQYISKGISPDPDQIIRIDFVSARFDSVYAPDGPDVPMQPTAVSYHVGSGDVPMNWNDGKKSYYYDNPYNLWFLAPGNDYTFNVTEGDDVPALSKTIYYPECGPYLNSPDAFSNVSRDGFEVTWAGHDAFNDCPTNIRIRIMDMGPMTWTDVDLMVPNNGSYTFTSGDLSGLDPMTYQIQVALIIETKEYIDEPGYDPRSWAWARTHSTLFLYLQ